MKNSLLISLAARCIGLLLGSGLLWYGLALRHSDDVFVDAALDHAVRHSAHESSKAGAAGSLLEMFSDLFGWGFVLMGGIFILLAIFPWARMAPRRTPQQ